MTCGFASPRGLSFSSSPRPRPTRRGGRCNRSSGRHHPLRLTPHGCETRSTASSWRSCAEKGLTPSPEADRRTLIRRLYVRPDRPAADARGGRRVRRPTRRPTPTRSSSIGCSRRRTTASAGPGTGWTSSTSPRRTATTRTASGRTPGRTATTSSARSTPTRRTRRFVQEQVAGDVLFPDDPRLIAGARASSPPGRGTRARCATSARTRIDREIGRYLDRDDMRDDGDVHRSQSLTVALRPLPRPQVRPDLAGRLLPAAGGVRRRRPGGPRVRPGPGGRRRRGTELQATLAALDRERPGGAGREARTPEFRSDVAAWESAHARPACAWHALETVTADVRSTARRSPQLPDGSVRSEGKRPEQDTYTVTAA